MKAKHEFDHLGEGADEAYRDYLTIYLAAHMFIDSWKDSHFTPTSKADDAIHRAKLFITEATRQLLI